MNYKLKDVDRINKISRLMLPSVDTIDGKQILLTEMSEAILMILAQWFNEGHFEDISRELHNDIEKLFDKMGWTEERGVNEDESWKVISSKIIDGTDTDDDEIVNQIFGIYGHDGCDIETTANILNLDVKYVEQIVEGYDIECGAF